MYHRSIAGRDEHRIGLGHHFERCQGARLVHDLPQAFTSSDGCRRTSSKVKKTVAGRNTTLSAAFPSTMSSGGVESSRSPDTPARIATEGVLSSVRTDLTKART